MLHADPWRTEMLVDDPFVVDHLSSRHARWVDDPPRPGHHQLDGCALRTTVETGRTQCRCPGQGGGAVVEHRRPGTLLPAQWTGVVDVDAVEDVRPHPTTDQPFDVVVGPVAVQDLAAADDSVLMREVVFDVGLPHGCIVPTRTEGPWCVGGRLWTNIPRSIR